MQGVTLVEGIPDTLTLFDGDFKEAPVRVPADCIVRYVQGCNASGGYVCTRGAGSHVEFCEFWNDTPPQGFPLPVNCHVFSVSEQIASSGNKTTSNEVSAFGMARKILQNWKSEWIDDNHLWCRFDGITKDDNTNPGEPLEFPSGVTSICYAGQYLSGEVVVRNSIITTGVNVDLRAAEGRPVTTQVIGADAPHATLGIDYVNVLAMAPRQVQPPFPQPFMRISKTIRMKAMNTLLDNVHVVAWGIDKGNNDAPNASEQESGVVGFDLADAQNPPKTGIYRNCWVSSSFFNRITSNWIQEGDFTLGVAPHLWPTLSDAQWKRISRATRMSSWPEAVKPGDQYALDYEANWNSPEFHRHKRDAKTTLRPLIRSS
jgi:hypothetical protein